MRVSDFHFDLPEELIAQHPPEERGASRMLVLDRGRNKEQDAGGVRFIDAMFRDLPEHLQPGDLLVLNDSRVLPARLFAVRAGLGTQAGSPRPSGVVEVLLTEEVADQTKENAGILRFAQNDKSDSVAQNDVPGKQPALWRVLVKPAKKVRVGETLLFCEAGGEVVLTAEVVEAGEFGERTLRFAPVEDFYGVVGRIGHMPLPPYIRREQSVQPDTVEDRERYQTVYSHELGSAAAPTAGLHFTAEVLAALRARGVEIASLTLHVGLGTFQPVRVAEVKDIRLHAERYTLPAATADALNRALAEGRRVVAVGTTTTRTLEHIAEQMALRTEGERHVPGAKAPFDSAPVMPGLKSRPISEPLSGKFSEALSGKFTEALSGKFAEALSGKFTEALSGKFSEALSGKFTEALSGKFTEALSGKFVAHSGVTSIFIGPGHRFRIVGGLLTNFHLPESTLLMLVAALTGDREMVLAAYAHAVREKYRFYSYGDCMLVV